MASVNYLEEGSCALKSGNLKDIKSLYDRLYEEVFVNRIVQFICEGEHFSLVRDRVKLSRCHTFLRV